MINWVAVQMPHGGYKYQSYANTTVNISEYQLPGNLIHLIHPIRLLLGTGAADSGYVLDRISKEEYDLIEPNPNRTPPPPHGRPSRYCIFSRCIHLTPIPDLATYLMEINWTKRAVDVSLVTDVPNLGSEWDQVLKQGVLERMYAGIGLIQDSAYWGSKYHAIVDGDDVPIGMAKRLFEIEKDRENIGIGQVQYNDL